MKFLSFLYNNQKKYGIIKNKIITDLTDKINGAKSLKELIEKKNISKAKVFATQNPGNIKLEEITQILRGKSKHIKH